MIAQLIIAFLTVVLVGYAILGWDRLSYLAAAVISFVLIALVRGWWQHRNRVDFDATSGLELGPSPLKDILAGLLLGAIVLGMTTVCAPILDPLIEDLITPLSRHACNQAIPRLDDFAEVKAWPKALSIINEALEQPTGYEACRDELILRKCEYIETWGNELAKQNNRDEALALAAECSECVQQYNLPGEGCELLAKKLEPTPTPAITVVTQEVTVIVPTATPSPSPTPIPSPTPRAVSGTARIVGIDGSLFPPSLVAYLQVWDESGMPITDLKESDFRVFNDGQPVNDFRSVPFSQSPPPICAAVVIDYSNSMSGAPIRAAKSGARTFLNLLTAKDQVTVIGFNTKVHKLQGWTLDKASASEALDQISPTGWTALWDAMWLATNEFSNCQGRRALVVLTDGTDNRSERNREEVANQARAVGAELFVIGLRTGEYNGSVLQALVDQVGGKYNDTADLAEIERFYREIAGTLQSEYRFVLTLDRGPDSNTHQLRIEVGWPESIIAEEAYQDLHP